MKSRSMSAFSQQPPCLTGVAADCFWILSRMATRVPPSDYSVPTANKVADVQQSTARFVSD
jgi:hypothetical protein